jgi:hypothetical protein
LLSFGKIILTHLRQKLSWFVVFKANNPQPKLQNPGKQNEEDIPSGRHPGLSLLASRLLPSKR